MSATCSFCITAAAHMHMQEAQTNANHDTQPIISTLAC